jgi:ubiquinone/menaquinone biosynthesis C-methylase UbiE
VSDLDRLMELFDGLPRAGPGSDAATAEALARLGRLPAEPRILDVGCGPGRQTLVLAGIPGARVVAVDVHASALARLAAEVQARGLAHRVEVRNADMRALPFPDASFDLVWSEGAAYLMGFPDALKAWRRLVVPGGAMGASELTWLSARPPAEAAAFWAAAYPGMRGLAENVQAAEHAGWHVEGTTVLPSSAWWPEFYEPLLARIEEKRRAHPRDRAWTRLLDEQGEEIDLFRRHGESYGYVFYLLRRTDGVRRA